MKPFLLFLHEKLLKKNTLIEKKADLEDQKSKILANGSIWVEPLEDWMKTCNQAAQSLESQNFHEMNCILKKIGLNHQISKKKLDIQFIKPYDFLFEIQPQTDSCSSPVKIPEMSNHQTQRSSACCEIDEGRSPESIRSNAVVERVSARRPRLSEAKPRASLGALSFGLAEWYRWPDLNWHGN